MFILDPTVRDSSAEALGTAMKLIGEKSMMPFLTDIDNLKMTKVNLEIYYNKIFSYYYIKKIIRFFI